MEKALFLVKKEGSKPISFGPREDSVSIDEIIRLEEGKMHVLGLEPGHVKEKLQKDYDLKRTWEEITPYSFFKPIEMPKYFRNISRAHCALFPTGKMAYLFDLDSHNGTFVNGNKIDARIELDTFDEFQIGHQELKIIQLPNYSHKRALIIAADDQGNLKGVRNDALAMEKLLKARKFNPRNITSLIYDKEGHSGKLPTRETVLEELENLANVQDENSLTFMHYSGHGENDGAISLTGKNILSYISSYFRTIEPSEIYDLTAKIPGYKVLIFDSCYSGKIKEFFARQKMPNSTIICSAKAEQAAYERKSFGDFTKNFLKIAAKSAIINPSVIAGLVHMKDQDKTFCGDNISF